MNRQLSTNDIATMLSCTAKHVRDVIVARPDFPPPSINLSRKMRRWDELAVVNYLKGAPRSGRPALGSRC